MGADTSSPHEASIAMERARKLMDKHQIEVSAYDEDNHHIYSMSVGTYKRIPHWALVLCTAVARCNDCVFVQKETGDGYTLQFRGITEDVELAVMVYKRLRSIIKRGVKHIKAKNDYRVGFALAIMEKCDKIHQGRNKDLVVSKRAIHDKITNSEQMEKTCAEINISENKSFQEGRMQGELTPLHGELK